MTQTFSLASWNVANTPHYSSLPFSRVEPHIQLAAQDVLCLQEFGSHHKVSRRLQPYLHGQQGSHSHNAILTSLPVLENFSLTPCVDHPVYPIEDIQVTRLLIGGVEVMIYNCHLPIVAAGLSHRIPLLQQILAHADGHQLPAAVCGDLNTTIPPAGWRRWLVQLVHRVPSKTLVIERQSWLDDEKHLASQMLQAAGFMEVFPIDQPTWAFPRTSWEVFGLKLDWISIRGMSVVSSCLQGYTTDHRKLGVTLTLPALSPG